MSKEKKFIHNCKLVPYGEVEKLCRVCGYVTYRDDNISDDEIIDQMIKDGYEEPECSKLINNKNGN